MSDKETGGSAFPQNQFLERGMTLRDYFAAKAMQSAIDREMRSGSYRHFCESVCKQIAVDAYMVADSMLEARNAN